MNWLSHILLSKRDLDYQLGNLLADPLKGVVWNEASKSFADGVSMHKAIDMYTDSHPIVSSSKARLGRKGYLKGVVIDILYDHFLSNAWYRYSSMSLGQFIDDFSSSSVASMSRYPSNASHFVHKLVRSDCLKSYVKFDGFVETLRRMDRRLSPRIIARETTYSYVEAVERNYDNLSSDFDEFFPELVNFFKHHKLGSLKDSYLL